MTTPREAVLEALILEALEDLAGVTSEPKTWLSRARKAVGLNPRTGYTLIIEMPRAKP